MTEETKKRYITLGGIKLGNNGLKMYMKDLYNKYIADTPYDFAGQIYIGDKLSNTEINKINKDFLSSSLKLVKSLDDININNLKSNVSSNKIFVLWLQPMIDNKVVKECISSIQRHANGHEVIILNESNLNNYIDIDDVIKNAYIEERMCKAHYSDYIRIAILSKYGGLWLDATMFCLKNISSSIFENDLYIPKDRNNRQYSNPLIRLNEIQQNGFITKLMSYKYASAYYILGGKDTRLFEHTKRIWLNYWKKYDYTIDYYLLGDILEYLISTYKEYNDMYKKCPLNNAFTEVLRWRNIE